MILSNDLYNFSAIAAAVFLEAMPFLAFGALIGAIIEVCFSPERLTRYIPKNIIAGTAVGILAGFFIPTCECGVVPIVRRMMGKGVAPHVVIPYMLAAPIINPIVLASTYIAFRGNLYMVVGRAAIAVIIAALFGLMLKDKDSSLVLLNSNAGSCTDEHECHCGGHLHSHADNSCCGSDHSGNGSNHKVIEVLRHAGLDFLDMGKYLVLGAIAAAFFKAFLPQETWEYFNSNIILSVSGMMILAVLLSICSEADAFVAASFIGFPPAAQLAFISIGPMVDLKLIGMFAASFHIRLFLALLIVPTVLVFGLSLVFGAVF